MKIISIKVYDNTNFRYFASNEFNFFTRSSAKEFTTFASNELIKRYRDTQLLQIPYEKYIAYLYHNPKIVIITDEIFNKRNIMNLIRDLSLKKKITNENIINYEKPDKIQEIQEQLDETVDIMYKNIDQILERGEKLEDLVNKSEDLSSHSRAFYYESKKMNRCCFIL